ncbi:AAA family ATPase [Gordonia sp. VNK21]|uniref:AAA family ATPase n=1 Tax=Gordonia sp. VNK21 TaxID=3382483 RepID=UPI0038D38D4A
MDAPIKRPLSPYDRFDLSKFVLHLDDMAPPPSTAHNSPAEISHWIQAAGPIETSELQWIQSAMTQLLRTNSSTINGARQWLGIDGPPMSGKTFSAVVAAMRIDTQLRISQTGDVEDPFEHIPVVIVSGNLGEPALARTLLDNIARFIGVVLPSGLSAAIEATARHLKNVGTLLIVVDDAHFIKRKSGSRNLTDALKDIITTIPASFVFVGAGLEVSALLHVPTGSGETTKRAFDSAKAQKLERDQYSAVYQLRERLSFHSVKLFPSEMGRVHPVLRNRMTTLINELDRIDGFDASALRSEQALERFSARSLGKTGLALRLITRTAAAAAETGASPTLDHVSAVTGLEISDD